MRGWRSVATLAAGNLQTTLLTGIRELETPLRRGSDSPDGPVVDRRMISLGWS
jgi:hypothetical protein